MTCAEFQELAGLMAMGALAPQELAQAEAHLAEPRHSGCFEALRSASDGAEVLARSLVAARPDERLWRGIESRLEGAVPRPARSAAPAWRERLAWAAAVAAAVLLLANFAARSRDNRRFAESGAAASAAAARLEKDREACSKELASARDDAEKQRSALALLQAPATLMVSLSPPAGGQPGARALLNVEQQKGMLLSGSLAPQPGKDYELWIIRGDRKLPAGLLRAGPSGVVLASIDPQLLASGRPDAVAVTLEVQGGALQPTGPILLVGALPKS